MIIREGTSEGGRCLLVNRETGDIYSRVKWFDTETKEAEVYVVVEEISDFRERSEIQRKLGLNQCVLYPGTSVAQNGGKPCTARVTLINAIAIDRFTLEEMK